MATDFDIKIDSVFSLADECRDNNGIDSSSNSSLYNRDDNGPINPSCEASAVDNNTEAVQTQAQCSLLPEVATHDVREPDKLDESSAPTIGDIHRDEKTISEATCKNHFIEYDAPPPLHMELLAPTMSSQGYICDQLHPPVLEPEEPIEEPPKLHVNLASVHRKRTIAPCYIALTSVQPFLKSKQKVNSRYFKKKFKDCLNICKKVHFTRQLNRGKDVFNVKLWKKMRAHYLQARLKQRDTSHMDSIAKTRTKTDCKKNTDCIESIKSPKLDRIRRKISHLPKDFDSRFVKSLDNESLLTQKNIVSETLEVLEREALQKEIESIKKHKEELLNLKRQIKLKRSLNKRMKSLRKVMTRASEATSFFGKETTSSISGRTRKPNKRYTQDGFIMTKEEIDYYMEETKQKGIIRKEMKLFEDRAKKEKSISKRSFHGTGAAKRPIIDLVIDNPEESEVHAFNAKVFKPSERKSSSEVPTVEKKVRHNKRKHKFGENRTDVLIRDLPSYDNVIEGMLMSSNLANSCGSSAVKGHVTEMADDPASSLRTDKDHQTTDVLLKEKFEKLKIPKSVQRLFQKSQDSAAVSAPSSQVPKLAPSPPGTVFNASVVQSDNPNLKKILLTKVNTNLTSVSKVGGTSAMSLSDGQRVVVGPSGLIQILPPNRDVFVRKLIDGNTSDASSIPVSNINTTTLSFTRPQVVQMIAPTTPQTTYSGVKTRPLGRVPIMTYSKIQPGTQMPRIVHQQTATSLLQKQGVLNSASVPLRLAIPNQALRPLAASSPVVLTYVPPPTISLGSTSAHGTIHTNSNSAVSTKSSEVACSGTSGISDSTQKTKFYLLNVDGKNILVPVNPNLSETPKAYVINGQTATNVSKVKVSLLTPQSTVPNTVSGQPSSAPLFQPSGHMTSLIRPISSVAVSTGPSAITSLVPTSRIVPLPVVAKPQTTTVTTLTTASVNRMQPSATGGTVNLNGNGQQTQTIVRPVNPICVRSVANVPMAIIKPEKVDAEFDKIEKGEKRTHFEASDDDDDEEVTKDTTVKTSQASSPALLTTTQAHDNTDTSPAEQPKAFADAVTAREERLRRLKALIKEKNEALEAIRLSTTKK